MGMTLISSISVKKCVFISTSLSVSGVTRYTIDRCILSPGEYCIVGFFSKTINFKESVKNMFMELIFVNV
jgi:hypothetical protein